MLPTIGAVCFDQGVLEISPSDLPSFPKARGLGQERARNWFGEDEVRKKVLDTAKRYSAHKKDPNRPYDLSEVPSGDP